MALQIQSTVFADKIEFGYKFLGLLGELVGMLQHPTDRIFPVNKLEEEKGSPENSIYLKQPVK